MAGLSVSLFQPMLPDRGSARPAYNEGEPQSRHSTHICDRHWRFGTVLELRSPSVPNFRSSLVFNPVADPRASISRAGSVLVSSIAGIAANLLQIATTGKPPHPNSCPAQLRDQLRQSPTRSCAPVSLRNFQDIENSLRGNAFDPIITNFSAQPF